MRSLQLASAEQPIFQGTRVRRTSAQTTCPTPPSSQLPKCTTNHYWANVASTLEFVQLVETRRDALVDAGKVPPHSPALIVWDVFYAHRDQSVLDYCRSKNIFVVFVSANCTGFPQVCDISVSTPWKAALAQSFEATVVKTIVENPERTCSRGRQAAYGEGAPRAFA